VGVVFAVLALFRRGSASQRAFGGPQPSVVATLAIYAIGGAVGGLLFGAVRTRMTSLARATGIGILCVLPTAVLHEVLRPTAASLGKKLLVAGLTSFVVGAIGGAVVWSSTGEDRDSSGS